MTLISFTAVSYWLVAIAAGSPFALLYCAYRRTLLGKRLTVQQVMIKKGVFKSYLDAFGLSNRLAANTERVATPQQVVEELFNLYYHWGSYAFGVVMNVVIVTLAVVCTLLHAKVPLALPGALTILAAQTPLTFSAAFAGAYIWNLYDLIRRYRGADLTPAAFQFSWLRMLAACLVGPLAGMAAAEGVKVITAFGIGVLPLQTMFEYFTNYASKRLGISTPQTPAAGPTLHNLQGMTTDMINRMEEEGIDSVAALAFADPMKLFLKTDIEWMVIIDFIDQALLFNYIGEKIPGLRPMGIRGSIEAAVIYERAKSNDADEQAAALEIIDIVATHLGQSKDEARNLVRTVWEDDQVNLIWNLFGESFSDSDEDNEGRKPSDTISERQAQDARDNPL